jgi:hypothetical protein
VLLELRAANALPYCRFPLNWDSESLFMIYLPHLATLKSCAAMLQLRSLAELQNGRPDKALKDVQLGLPLADANNGTFVPSAALPGRSSYLSGSSCQC